MKNIRISKRVYAHYAKGISLLALVATVTSPPVAASAAERTAVPEEIIVTARKREESIMKVPVVIQALSQKQIQNMHLTTVSAITAATPNLQIREGFALAGIVVNMRGLGNGASANFIDQSVALNIDGFTSNSGTLYRQGMFDASQIEVMKGPQALFYGKSTSVGLIAIHSADPTASWDTKVGIGYEFEADEMDLDGYISGPLTDKLGVRIAGFHNTSKGYLYNPNPNNPSQRIPAINSNGGRLTLKYTDPDVGLRIKLKTSFTHDRVNTWYPGENMQVCPAGTTLTPFASQYSSCRVGFTTSGYPASKPYGAGVDFSPTNPSAFANFTPAPGFGDGKSYATTRTALSILNVDYDLTPDVTLSSVTALDFVKAKDAGGNGTPGVGLIDLFGETKTQEFSQELRLTTNWKDRWYNFMVGGLYNPTTRKDHLVLNLSNFLFFTDDRTQLKSETDSVFGQVLLTPIDKWELSAGVRYSHVDKHFVSMIANTNLLPPAGEQIQNVPLANRSFSQKSTTPEFTLTYRPTDDVTAFVSYKHGYKGPGYNADLTTRVYNAATNVSPFGGEKVKGVEGGIKAQLLDRQLSLTAIGYLYDYKGLQVSFTNVVTSQVTIANRANARVQGIELEGTYSANAVPGLTLNAFVNYNDAHYTSFSNAPCYGNQTLAMGCITQGTARFQNLGGRTLNYAPPIAGFIGATYGWDLNETYSASVDVRAKYSGDYLTSPELNEVGRQKAYTLLDLAVRAGRSDGAWELGVVCRNCTNRLYIVTASDGGAGSTPVGVPATISANIARPREVLLQLTVHPYQD